MLWKHKIGICVMATLLTSAGVFLVHRMQNIYRADALVLVDSQKIPEKFVASTVQVSLQDSLSAISQQVLSTDRVLSIIDDFGLYKEERKKKSQEEIVDLMRKKDLSITLERSFSGSRSGAFRIAYEGPDPNVVAGVVGRIADLFVQENLRTREERATGTSEFIESQLQQAKKSLDEQEAALSRYKLQWAGELPQQEAALLQTLARLQAELEGNQDAINRTEQNRMMLESTLRFAESALNVAIQTAEPAPVVAQHDRSDRQAPAVRSSDLLRAQLRAAMTRYSENHPEVRRLRKELNLVLVEEAATPPKPVKEPDTAAEQKLSPGTPPALLAEVNRQRERVATTKTQLELVEKELKARGEERHRILASISEYQQRVERLPIREQQMAGLTRDYENSKIHYRSLLDKKISAEMATDMERQQQSERFTIADPPRVPKKPVKPKRLILYAASALLALALAVGLALGLEFLRNEFLGEWELPEGVRVMGHISVIRGPAAAGVNAARFGLIFLLAALFSSIAGLIAMRVASSGTH